MINADGKLPEPLHSQHIRLTEWEGSTRPVSVTAVLTSTVGKVNGGAFDVLEQINGER